MLSGQAPRQNHVPGSTYSSATLHGLRATRGMLLQSLQSSMFGVDGSRAWKTGAQGRAIKSSGVTDSCTLDSPPLPLKDVAPLQS